MEIKDMFNNYLYSSFGKKLDGLFFHMMATQSFLLQR